MCALCVSTLIPRASYSTRLLQDRNKLRSTKRGPIELKVSVKCSPSRHECLSSLRRCRANTQRAGAYISNFQTNDKAVIEVMPTRLDMDIVDMAVRAAVSPGSLEDTSKVSIPPRDKVKVETREVDGRQYTYLRFPSTTLTNSGYDIRRQNLAAAIERKGKTYVLVASARGDQFNQQKEQQLAYVAASFRVN